VNVPVPELKPALAGNEAFASEELIATVSLPPLIKFQFASTAFTVRLNVLPAVCVAGVPVFPVLVPGAAVSPGTSNCNFANEPDATVTAGLVFAVAPA